MPEPSQILLKALGFEQNVGKHLGVAECRSHTQHKDIQTQYPISWNVMAGVWWENLYEHANSTQNGMGIELQHTQDFFW